MAKAQRSSTRQSATTQPSIQPTTQAAVQVTVPPAVAGIDFARQVARIAADHRAEDVVILDLRGLSAIADFFVIATGTSDRQMRAVAEAVEEYGSTMGQRVYGRCGYESATWVLVDYVDVVVHIFDKERRQYYDLELLWGDAPRVSWDESAGRS